MIRHRQHGSLTLELANEHQPGMSGKWYLSTSQEGCDAPTSIRHHVHLLIPNHLPYEGFCKAEAEREKENGLLCQKSPT